MSFSEWYFQRLHFASVAYLCTVGVHSTCSRFYLHCIRTFSLHRWSHFLWTSLVSHLQPPQPPPLPLRYAQRASAKLWLVLETLEIGTDGNNNLFGNLIRYYTAMRFLIAIIWKPLVFSAFCVLPLVVAWLLFAGAYSIASAVCFPRWFCVFVGCLALHTAPDLFMFISIVVEVFFSMCFASWITSCENCRFDAPFRARARLGLEANPGQWAHCVECEPNICVHIVDV